MKWIIGLKFLLCEMIKNPSCQLTITPKSLLKLSLPYITKYICIIPSVLLYLAWFRFVSKNSVSLINEDPNGVNR